MKKTTPGADAPAQTPLTLAQAEQGIQIFFGRTPEKVVQPLHRAYEALNWLNALFECIEDVNANHDRAHSAGLIHALSGLGAWVSAEYQVVVIGEVADDMQTRLDAAREDYARGQS